MLKASSHPRAIRALIVAAAVAGGLLLAGPSARSATSLQGQIAATRSATELVNAAIAADSKRIQATVDGLAEARNLLGQIQTDLDHRVAQLRTVQAGLLASQARLLALENRMRLASGALAANLVASYEASQPDLMTVILESRGFGDLLEQVSFMARQAHQDARVLKLTRANRAAVLSEANRLGRLEVRDRWLAQAILQRRNDAAALG